MNEVDLNDCEHLKPPAVGYQAKPGTSGEDAVEIRYCVDCGQILEREEEEL